MANESNSSSVSKKTNRTNKKNESNKKYSDTSSNNKKELKHEYDTSLMVYKDLSESFLGSLYLKAYLSSQDTGFVTSRLFNDQLVKDADCEENFVPQDMHVEMMDNDKKKKKLFNPRKVAEIVMRAQFDRFNIEFNREEFEELAKQLVYLFPAVGPTSVWFTQTRSKGKRRKAINAGGYLYQEYKKLLALGISCGLLDKAYGSSIEDFSTDDV